MLNTINEYFPECHNTRIFDFVSDLAYNEFISEDRLNDIDSFFKE